MSVDRRLERAPKGKKTIRWTDDEWDRLAQQVWVMRKNNPAEFLPTLVRRAQESWPADRRRDIKGNKQIEPLLTKLSQIDERYRSAADQLPSIQQQVESLRQKQITPEDVINSLTDREILRHFGDKVLQSTPLTEVVSKYSVVDIVNALPLNDMAIAVVQKILFSLDRTKIPIVSEAPIKNTTKKLHKMKVVILGMIANQHLAIRQAFGDSIDLSFVEVERNKNHTIPENADLYVLWAKFCSHDSQDQVRKLIKHPNQMIVHHGGINQMIKKILERINVGQAA